MKRHLLAVPLALALLGGCASADPADDVRERVAAVIDAANARDEAGVRLAVADLIELLGDQTDNGELTPQEAQAIANAARRVAEGAGELAPSPSPPPSPVVTEEPEPTPEPEPTEQEPSPTPEPEPTEDEPEPTEEPDDQESEEPVIDLPTEPTEDPATESASAPSPSPAAQVADQPSTAPTA